MKENTEKLPMMKKGVATWLVNETCWTFEQIARFCGLHVTEVQAIADGEVNFYEVNPILSGQLTKEEIELCNKDSSRAPNLREDEISNLFKTKKEAKYTPVKMRIYKPDAIAFLLKYYPYITNPEVKKLIGTTDKTVNAIRNETYKNMQQIIPRDPVTLGFCSQSQLDDIEARSKNNIEKNQPDQEELFQKITLPVKKEKKSTKKTSKNTKKSD